MLLYIKAKPFDIELYYDDQSKEMMHQEIEDYLTWLCECYSSTLISRKQIACKLLQIKQLPPIVIKDDLSLILFACKAKTEDVWYYFNYESIIDIKSYNDKSKVVFINGESIVFDCSARSMKKQRDRCWCLKNVLRCRQNEDHLRKLIH